MSVQDSLAELQYGGPEVRARAAANLGRVADPATLPILIAALDDSEPEVRAAIAESLALFRSKEAVPKLIPLLQDKSWVVREAVATTLGIIADPAASRPLLDLIDKNYNREINTQRLHQTMMETTIALGRIKDPRATPTLTKMLKKGYRSSISDWQLQVRQAAALGLGYLDQPAGVEALLGVLSDGEAPDIIRTALTALTMVKNEQNFKPLVNGLSVGMLEDARKIWPRQQGAVVGLGALGNPKAVPYLLPMVDNQAAEVRKALANSLAQLGDDVASKDALLKLLRDRMAEVRAAAAQALGHLQISDASGALNVVLRDPNRLVSGAAQVALDQIKALPPASGNSTS